MTALSSSFLGLSGLRLNIMTSQQSLVFTSVLAMEGRISYISGAHNANIALGSDADTVRIEVTTVPSFNPPPTSSTVVATSNSTFRTRQGDDTLRFTVSAVDPITGVGVAVQNSHISGNRGNDTIYMEASAGKTRLWGQQAVVFGGAGDDVVTGVGAAQNCFIQMGLGNDDLSIGQHTYTNTALRWTRLDGTQASYGIIRGGDGTDIIRFQHLSLSQFQAAYHPIANGFTLGADPTKYLEFETVVLNDGQSVPLV